MRPFEKLALGAYAFLAAVALAGAPALSFLERAPLCLFKAATGLPCPGCGMTHALIFAFQGKWAESFRANPVGIPLLAVWTLWLASVLAGRRLEARRPWPALALVGVLAAYFLRLAGIC